jgi:hypothetical protein
MVINMGTLSGLLSELLQLAGDFEQASLLTFVAVFV